MAINRYRLTSKVTLPPGTFTGDVQAGTASSTPLGIGSPANYGTGSYAQGANEYGSGAGGGGSTTWLAGMELLLDPTKPLYTAIGSGNLVLIPNTTVDDVGHSGLSN
jgi:hypothetical protein